MDRVDAALKEMEGYLWELSAEKEDKEVISTVLATVYHFRGSPFHGVLMLSLGLKVSGRCDFVCDRFDVALSYYAKALKCLESHRDLGDGDAMASLIRHDVERAMCLKPKEEAARNP